MERLNLDRVYVLNPAYHLRHDIHRVVLFSRGGTDNLCSRNWCTFIHPLQAALLSFFTHDRKMGETIGLLCDFFCRTEEEVKRWVTELVDNPEPVCSRSGQEKIYLPKRILVDWEENGGNAEFTCMDAGQFLWKRLDLKTRRLYTGPLIVTLMLNNRCLTRCRYCYADTTTDAGKGLGVTRWLELIREAARMEVAQVNLMGGEVFLYKEWPVLLKELVRLDVAPDFLSTKIPPDKELVARLKECGYKGVLQLSLDACDDSTLHRMVGTGPGYAGRMMEGLRLLDKSGLKYQVATVLTTDNCHMEILEEMFRQLAVLKNLHDWRIVPVSNSITKEYREFARLKPTGEQLANVFERMEELTRGYGGFPVILGREMLERQFRQTDGGSCRFKGSECSALTTHLFVLPDGKVTICEQLYWNPRFIIGDAGTATLKEIWDSPRARELYGLSRKEISPQSRCGRCELFECCFGYHNRCWSNVIKAYGEDCWDYPDPRCRYAPEMKNRLGYD